MGKKILPPDQSKNKKEIQKISKDKLISKNGKRNEKIPSNIVALDCEMVGVGKGRKSALARCSIVDYHGDVLYDSYVKPKDKITDYRTRYSGIMPSHMKNATSFKDAQFRVQNIIKDKWIVGHAIHTDLKILQIEHESTKIRDTSKFISLRMMAGLPILQTPSLRNLSQSILGVNIQSNTHCSVEDSKAAMNLYRKVEDEWEQTSNENNKTKYLDDVFWPESVSMY